MRITIAQLKVERTMVENEGKLLAVLGRARPGDWVIFPEGVLTGYFPDEEGFLRDTNPDEVERAIRGIGEAVRRLRCHCAFGSATFVHDRWHNSVIVQGPLGEQCVYHKIQLSRPDTRHFARGDTPSTYTLSGTCVGVQVCREVLFPEPWARLRQQGAHLIIHANNAIKPHDEVWEHVLIARAVENVCFVCSVNNAAPPQQLTSYLIAPSGELLAKAGRRVEETLTREIDLSEAGKATAY